MRILVLGANGFIGRHLIATLLGAGHHPVACVRRPEEMTRRFPSIEAVACDLARDIEPGAWLPRLDGIDAVVNAAGVLRGRDIEAIHATSPAALYAACVEKGVRRVVHISAISADESAATPYAMSKLRGEEALRKTALDWVILRPSLVYGHGSYGGTSLLRGLAGFPCVTPLPGDGSQPFQPIHIDDLARTVLTSLSAPSTVRTTLSPVGPETLTVRQIVTAWRAWLGFPPAKTVAVPMSLLRLAGRLGDVLGSGPVSSVAIRQMEHGNVGEPAAFANAAGFQPRRMSAMLAREPATVQDAWHARLYFARPLTRYALAFIWMASALLGLFASEEATAMFARAMQIPPDAAHALGILFSAADLAIAAALVMRARTRPLAIVQLALVAGYTVGLGWIAPQMLLDPFGALLKNAAVLVLIVAWAALDDDR